ncbi:MAG: quinone-dependent dihydroorotate dehydrogenase [Flavobacteriales bacterium]|nr:quinone-dependent dihydroorotate dehydrogenase [Flavobacteriales bacterium]
MYRRFLRPIAFVMDPEKAHYRTMGLFGFGLKVPVFGALLKKSLHVAAGEDAAVEVAGLKFPHRIGLAAGFDKDGKWLSELSTMGFAFVEVGTITPKAQPGNPKPRLFRLKDDRGLINRMGFNNGGLEELIGRLKNRPKGLIVGGNIGRNKVTPNDRASDDYLTCFEGLHPHVDYFAVNVSSPNTPGLRELQDRAPLTALLNRLQAFNRAQDIHRPVFLKIAPDLSDAQLDDIVGLVADTGIEGVIATNTTISREGLQMPDADVQAIGAGGLSGAPVRSRSTEVVRYLRQRGDFAIIGVGGVEDGPSAREKVDAGADLVQVYSGMIYTGPGIVRACLSGLGN